MKASVCYIVQNAVNIVSTQRPRHITTNYHHGECLRNNENDSPAKKKLKAGRFVLSNGKLTETRKLDICNSGKSSENDIVVLLPGIVATSKYFFY